MARSHSETRPAKRRAKDVIDVERTRAVLATDLTGSKGWAVEIKVISSPRHPATSFRSNCDAGYSQSGDSNPMPRFSRPLRASSGPMCVGFVWRSTQIKSRVRKLMSWLIAHWNCTLTRGESRRRYMRFGTTGSRVMHDKHAEDICQW